MDQNAGKPRSAQSATLGAAAETLTLPGMIIRVFEARIRGGRFAEFDPLDGR